jgi:hypothetical protein
VMGGSTKEDVANYKVAGALLMEKWLVEEL